MWCPEASSVNLLYKHESSNNETKQCIKRVNCHAQARSFADSQPHATVLAFSCSRGLLNANAPRFHHTTHTQCRHGAAASPQAFSAIAKRTVNKFPDIFDGCARGTIQDQPQSAFFMVFYDEYDRPAEIQVRKVR